MEIHLNRVPLHVFGIYTGPFWLKASDEQQEDGSALLTLDAGSATRRMTSYTLGYAVLQRIIQKLQVLKMVPYTDIEATVEHATPDASDDLWDYVLHFTDSVGRPVTLSAPPDSSGPKSTDAIEG